jgi:hypothetical protein
MMSETEEPEVAVVDEDPPVALSGLVVLGAEDAEACSDGTCV